MNDNIPNSPDRSADSPPQFAEDVLPMVKELSLGEQERLLHLIVSDKSGIELISGTADEPTAVKSDR